MINVNFINTNQEYTFNSNLKIKSFSPFNEVEEVNNQPIKVEKNNLFEFQKYILAALRYLESKNALPLSLPSNINIRFTSASLFEKLNPFHKDSVAETDISENTIYLSTQLLGNVKDKFLKDFSEKFESKESLIDAVFYHELAHLIFKYEFKNLTNLYSNFQNKSNHNARLYQILRNLEENFADGFSALFHKEKNNLFDVYAYVASRNSTNQNKTKGFDLNINALGRSFEKINDIDIASPIKDISKQILNISIKSSIEVSKEIIKNNPNFEEKLYAQLHAMEIISDISNVEAGLKKVFGMKHTLSANINQIHKRMWKLRDEHTSIKSTSYSLKN